MSTSINKDRTRAPEEQEYLVRWQQEFAALKVKRDHLAKELGDNFSDLAARIAGIAARIGGIAVRLPPTEL